MARENKAQREARLAAERAAEMAQNRADYPARLMEALERVSKQYPLELSVREGLFVVSDRQLEGYRVRPDYELPYFWDTSAQTVLENLEWALANLEEEQAEERRREEVRVAAQKKVQELFSEEERELLEL